MYDIETTNERQKEDEAVSLRGILLYYFYINLLKGVNILIANRDLLFVSGSQMDFKDDGLSQQFVFENSRAVNKCGCGLSFQV